MDALGGGAVVVAGADGMIGRHLLADLRERGVDAVPVAGLSSNPASLRRLSRAVRQARPRFLFYAPAERFGIAAHRGRPAEFARDSTTVFLHILESARLAGGCRVVNVLSNCVYPAKAAAPLRESDVWDGLPEPALAAYGTARRLSLTQAAAYRSQYGLRTVSVILSSVYGPHDNFDPESAQVLAAMIRRFTSARREGVSRVVCWGTGMAVREFIHVVDAVRGIREAAACYDSDEPLNISGQREVTVRELAAIVAGSAGYRGAIEWDVTRPDGRLRVSLDATQMRSVLPAWDMVGLEEGVAGTTEWFVATRLREGSPWREHPFPAEACRTGVNAGGPTWGTPRRAR